MGYQEEQADARCGRHALNHAFGADQVSDGDLEEVCQILTLQF